MTRFIFITGGVVSSLGKGVASASIGAILEARGLSVCLTKLDPYINVDPGTMSPHQHGEVYVTSDGAETDLDMGYYGGKIHQPLRKLFQEPGVPPWLRDRIPLVYINNKLRILWNLKVCR